jgi:hypothetical protein
MIAKHGIKKLAVFAMKKGDKLKISSNEFGRLDSFPYICMVVPMSGRIK